MDSKLRSPPPSNHEAGTPGAGEGKNPSGVWVTPDGRSGHGYGFVVDSVNVSVLPYVPVRRPSVALMVCLNVTDTGSLAIAAGYVSSTSGLALPLTGANADAG